MGDGLFVGRHEELGQLQRLVSERRLITVTGPGGVGKTSLANTLATSLSGTKRVVVADLTGVDDASAVEPVIAQALGQAAFDTVGPATVVGDTVLVVDNCEHVLDAAARALTTLRVRLPGVAVCTTSRTPLEVRDEVVLVLDPLRVPPPRIVDPEATAVKMFLAVVARVGAGVRDDDLGDVCELCRRLDGVPLAIEIAATRTRSMSPGEILRRLGDRLDTLSQGGFRREDRHRTVRDAVMWSYQLLDPQLQVMFDRLGVLAGAFSHEIAHAVAGHDDLSRTLDRLDELVAASLLRAERAADGTTWFHQLHAVRACAREHLDTQDELIEVTERFVDHMVETARGLAEHSRTGWSVKTIVSITALYDSLLHALRWTIEHDVEPTRAFDLMTVLWGHQFRTDELFSLGRRALARWPDTTSPRWADAAATVATCAWNSGRWDEADVLIERALEVEGSARFAPVLLRRTRGQVLRERGRLNEAIQSFDAGLSHARRLGLEAFVSDLRLVRAAAVAATGRIEEAIETSRRVREDAPPVGGEITWVLALAVETDALLWHDPDEAVSLGQRGGQLAQLAAYVAAQIGFGRTVTIGLALQGKLVEAAESGRTSLDLLLEHGTLSQAGAMLEAVAVVAHRAGSDRWRELLLAARAVPATHLLTSAASLLPEVAADRVATPDLATALTIARDIVSSIVDGDPRDTAKEPRAEPVGKGHFGAKVAPQRDEWSRRGDRWEVRYAGRSVNVKHTKGMEDLARLLAAPDTEVSAVDLAEAVVESANTGELIDPTARQQYERRIRELYSELAEAEDRNDLGRIERVTAELDAMVEHLSSAVGLGGRSRRSGGSSERARTAVTRRIRNAIGRLAEYHPILGRHLEASVRTGTLCAYRPEHPAAWHVER